MAEIILCNISDYIEITKEARNEWIIETLLALNVSEDIVELGFGEYYDRNEYIVEMNELGITVETHSNGEVNVYKRVWRDGPTEESSGWLPAQDQHLVAQWKLPEKVRVVDGDDIYYEIHLKKWFSDTRLK